MKLPMWNIFSVSHMIITLMVLYMVTKWNILNSREGMSSESVANEVELVNDSDNAIDDANDTTINNNINDANDAIANKLNDANV